MVRLAAQALALTAVLAASAGVGWIVFGSDGPSGDSSLINDTITPPNNLTRFSESYTWDITFTARHPGDDALAEGNCLAVYDADNTTVRNGTITATWSTPGPDTLLVEAWRVDNMTAPFASGTGSGSATLEVTDWDLDTPGDDWDAFLKVTPPSTGASALVTMTVTFDLALEGGTIGEVLTGGSCT